MNILGATDKPYAAHSITPDIDVFFSGRYYFRMGGESEVVIGTKIQNRLAVYNDLRSLFAGDDALFFEQSGSFDLFQFGGYPGNKFLVHICKN